MASKLNSTKWKKCAGKRQHKLKRHDGASISNQQLVCQFRTRIRIRIRDLSHARKLHHNMWMEIFLRTKTMAAAIKSWLAVWWLVVGEYFFSSFAASRSTFYSLRIFLWSVCGDYFFAYSLFCKMLANAVCDAMSDKQMNSIKLNSRIIRLFMTMSPIRTQWGKLNFKRRWYFERIKQRDRTQFAKFAARKDLSLNSSSLYRILLNSYKNSTPKKTRKRWNSVSDEEFHS